jgi:pimeloyl-[acyl-carrier protein] methyl ester esterase
LEPVVLSQLYVESYGAGPPVILVHGWGMHGGVWRQFAQQLSANYNVFCVDLPGHGNSEPITPFTLSTVAQQLAQQISDEPACWVGWSLGANVVLALAAEFPTQVSSLVLIAGNPCFTQSMAWPGMAVLDLEHFIDNAERDVKRTIARFMALQVRGIPGFRSVLSDLKRQLQVRPHSDQRTLMAGLEILRSVDQRAVFAQLSMPHLLLLGDKDPVVPLALAQAIDEGALEINYSVIGGAGHLPFLTHEDQIVVQIKKFLKKVS